MYSMYGDRTDLVGDPRGLVTFPLYFLCSHFVATGEKVNVVLESCFVLGVCAF